MNLEIAKTADGESVKVTVSNHSSGLPPVVKVIPLATFLQAVLSEAELQAVVKLSGRK